MLPVDPPESSYEVASRFIDEFTKPVAEACELKAGMHVKVLEVRLGGVSDDGEVSVVVEFQLPDGTVLPTLINHGVFGDSWTPDAAMWSMKALTKLSETEIRRKLRKIGFPPSDGHDHGGDEH